jgi:rod shape-determining protein MreD
MGIIGKMAKRDNRLVFFKLMMHLLVLVAITVVSTTGAWYFPYAFSYIDIFLIATVVVSVRSSILTSELFGLSAGLLSDVFTGGIIGMHALSLLIIGYLFAGLRQAVLVRSLWQQCLGITVVTLLNSFLLLGFHGLFNLPYSVDWLSLLVKTILNTIAGSAALYILHRLSSNDIDASVYEEH